MTDRTPDFNLCLKEKGVPPILKKSYDLQAINSFLQEAHKIVRWLPLSNADYSSRHANNVASTRMPGYQS